MGVSSHEKAELVVYQLKDMAQVWYEQWKGERTIREGSVNWATFKTTFLDRFFPFELWARKCKNSSIFVKGV